MTAVRSRIEFINTHYDEVATKLRAGMTAREISDLLAEPLPNVMGVWDDLRRGGEIDTRTVTQQFTSHATTPPAPVTTPVAVATPAPQPAPAPQPTPVAGIPNPPPPPEPQPEPEAVDENDLAYETGALLTTADHLNDPEINQAAERVRHALTDLSALLQDHESKRDLRDRIAQLEEELAAARAELGDAPAKTTPKPDAQQKSCEKGCGRTFKSDGWRARHEATCSGVTS